MYLLTNEQMRKADAFTIREKGVPSLLLMERAGLALADEVCKMKPEKAVCVAGGGNNGGDGFVCARILKSRGIETSVVFYKEKCSDECRVNMEKWIAEGGEIFAELPSSLGENCVIVDCLYGTGFHGELTGKDKEIVGAIRLAKRQGAQVLSADIPSGLSGDSGLAKGECVESDVTVCIGERKAGVLLGDGIDFAGKVVCADIGIQLPKEEEYATFFDEGIARGILPIRKRNSHKGSYGKAAIVAGSEEYTGAAYLSAAACLRSGAGYTALFLPSEILPHYILKLPEVLLKKVSDGGRYEFNEEKMRQLLEYDSVAFGMGMGVSEEVKKGAEWLICHYEGKLILDADGLNSLARYGKEGLKGLFARKKCDLLLTPHCKELARLSAWSVAEILEKGLSASRELAEEFGVPILLKNAVSQLSDGCKTTVIAEGCSGQAKAGSGDVLSGLIAGLCANGLTTYEAGALATWLCGRAATIATTERESEYSLTASDVIAYLGRAFRF